MKKLVIALAVVLTMALAAGAAFAENSKFTIQVNGGTIIPYGGNDGWQDVLKQRVKVASDKALYVNPSLLCGLYTYTKVTTSSATATAKVEVRVKMVGISNSEVYWAKPNGEDGIVYSRRIQTLAASLYQNLGEQYVSLLLDTMDAHSFNFLLYDDEGIPSGTYDIIVQAKVTPITESANITAKAMIGGGSVAIQEVRLIKNPAYPYDVTAP